MIKSRNNTNNKLSEEVDKNGWQRKNLPFETIMSSDLMDFPEMMTMDESDNMTIQFVKDKTSILNGHIGRKVYKWFIEYKPNTIGCGRISRYSCECANGLRTNACCSHVAAIIFYLTYGRYLAKIPRPAAILDSLFNKDNIIPVINTFTAGISFTNFPTVL